MKKNITNMAASVHARLLNRAKSEDRPFNEVLQYYAMERFLYRLSRSDHASDFVLKGALMLQVWGGPQARSTKDIDLLRTSTAAVTDVVAIARDCLRVDVEDDGLRFDVDGIQGEEIRRNAKYNGARLRVRAFLGKAEIALQVDVGFGDVITPHPTPFAYPSLLELDEPKLVGTTPETAIAEKFEAMVTLDLANTRMKDFFDIWLLSERREFSGRVLFDAVRATFTRRGTPLPSSVPIALTSSFYANPSKKAQWKSYAKKARVQDDLLEFNVVANQIENFLLPVTEALLNERVFVKRWRPGGPWRT